MACKCGKRTVVIDRESGKDVELCQEHLIISIYGSKQAYYKERKARTEFVFAEPATVAPSKRGIQTWTKQENVKEKGILTIDILSPG